VSSESKTERERRRRAEKLLGDLLPDTTSDESDEGWNDKEGDSRDDEMRRDVPPHHGQ
jgi:hypothetical protein